MVLGAVVAVVRAADVPGPKSVGFYAIHAVIGAVLGLLAGAVLQAVVSPGSS
jgi:hypothetical protein